MKRSKLSVLGLEDRCNPATFGIPWADPRHLTLSFAPDQTPISSATSSLFATLDSQFPTIDWREDILRAAQTWAATTNINIGLISDGGEAFGSTSTNSGAIRVGAAPLASTALAIGVPPNPYFGDSWSGEIIYNSTNILNPATSSLFSVFLHEFGHAIGLGGSSDPNAAMYQQATSPHTGLSIADLVAARALYGTRQHDEFDQKENNGKLATATGIEFHDYMNLANPVPGLFPSVWFGDVTSTSDVDYYRIDVPTGYMGSITVRVKSRGISLLSPKATLISQSGNTLDTSTSLDLGGGSLVLRIDQVNPNQDYFIRVESGTAGVFGIGSYAAAATYDGLVNPAYATMLDSVMVSRNDSIDDSDFPKLFTNPGEAIVNDDANTDDTIATAEILATNSQVSKIVGSIASVADVDYYRVRMPPGANALTIASAQSATNGAATSLDIFDATGQALPAIVLYNHAGRQTIQAVGLTPATDYYIRVRGADATQAGNYELAVVTNAIPAAPMTLAAGVVDDAGSTQSLAVVQNQVFHFLLSSQGAPGTGVRMTVTAYNGAVLYDLTAYSGQAINNAPVLLRTGRYTINYRLVGTGNVSFTLTAAVLSDPIGPALPDGTQAPAGPGSGQDTYYLTALKRFKRALASILPTAEVIVPGNA